MKLNVPLGFSRITTCQKGRRTTEHLDLWYNGESKRVMIFCKSKD